MTTTQFNTGDIAMFAIMLCAFTAAPPPVDPYREAIRLREWLSEHGMKLTPEGSSVPDLNIQMAQYRQFAQRYPQHDAAIDALFEVLRFAGDLNSATTQEWARQELQRHARRSLESAILYQCAKQGTPAQRDFLAEVLAHNSNPRIRFWAANAILRHADRQIREMRELVQMRIRNKQPAARIRLPELALERIQTSKSKAEAYMKELHDKGELANLAMGQPAPALHLVDWDGKPVSLADLRGKVVVLEFWFANCGPCRARIPASNALAKEMKGKPFTTVWVVTDAALDAPKRIRANTPIEGQHWWVKPEAGKRNLGPLEHWNVLIDGYPSVWVIDHKGVLRHHQTGYDATTDKVPEVVRDLVKKVEAPR
jgi:peroxiredoxin